MRTIVLAAIIFFLSACSLILHSDIELENRMLEQLDKGELRAAYDLYNALSTEQQRGKLVARSYQKLQRKVARTRSKIEQLVSLALEKGQWKRAIDLYNSQMPLLEVDRAFKKSYEEFVSKQALAIKAQRDKFIAQRAEYLLKEIPVKREGLTLDPYNSDKHSELHNLERESKQLARQLTELGVTAIRARDIAKARLFIPLASELDDTKAIKKANKALEKITQPLDKIIEILLEQGMRHYSDEEYLKSLEKWNDVLFLDPYNHKAAANKQRNEKVLQSLDAIKRGRATVK